MASRATSGKRSWRHSSTTPEASRKTRSTLRWLLPALLLVLALVFAWILIPSCDPTSQLVAVRIGENQRMTAPPRYYGDEDAQVFRRLFGDRYVQPIKPASANRENLSSLGGRLEGSSNTLILYVSGQGVSEDGKAYFLATDYQHDNPGGRIEAGELLKQASESSAKLKVVLLEAGRIGADGRLGMIVNEFPSLLEEVVKESGDDDLWVLVSHGEFEVSAAAHSYRQTVFGRAVAEGLSGLADRPAADGGSGDGDGKVTLRELYAYVASRAGGWFGGSSVSQTPQLLQGGRGPVELKDVDRDLFLTKVSAMGELDPKPDGEEGAKEGEKKNEEKEKKPTPQELVRQDLHEAWKIRDELEGRETVGGWSPIDFAPQWWRVLCAELIDYEQRVLAGDLDATKGDVEDLLDGLKELRSEMNRGVAAESRLTGQDMLTTDRLRESWRRLLNTEEGKKVRASYEENPPHVTMQSARDASRYFADASYRAADYVRWHEQLSLVSPTAAESLHLSLLDFFERLEQLAPVLEPASTRQVKQPDVADLDYQRANLSRAEAPLQQALAETPGSADSPAEMRLCEAMLSTPLLAADDRDRLLGLLLAAPPMESAAEPDARSASVSVSELDRWRAAVQRADLYVRLVAIADAGLAAPLEAQVDAARGLVEMRGGSRRSELRGALRTLGIDLMRTLREVRSDMGAAGSTAELRLARLLDPRDARRAKMETNLFHPLPFVAEPLPPLITIRPITQTVELEEERPLPIEFEVLYNRQEPLALTARLEYDATAIEVRQGPNLLVPGREFSPLLESRDATATFPARARFTAQAIADRDAAGTIATKPVTLTVQPLEGRTIDGRPVAIDAAPALCSLPGANFIELIVKSEDGDESHVVSAGDRFVRLRTWPNRDSRYTFSLKNRSGKPKDVSVKLLAVKRPIQARFTPGFLFADEGQDKLYLGVEDQTLNHPVELASIDSLPLPDSKPVAIPFIRPAEGAPADGAAAAPPTYPPITDGLALVITNTVTGQSWTKWIEINPISPAEYFEAPRIGYDPKRAEVFAELTPIADRLPPNLAAEKNEMPIRWDIAGELRDTPSGTTAIPKYKGTGTARLAVQVVPSRDRIPEEERRDLRAGNAGNAMLVKLDIDGYPRAFVYRVEMVGEGGGVHLGEDYRNQPHVKINSARVTDFPRLYYRSFLDPPEVEMGPDGMPKFQLFPFLNDAIIFPAGRDTLTFKLEVDAHREAFQKTDSGDVLAVSLSRSGTEVPLALYADRQMKAELKSLGPAGGLLLHTAVSDYELSLPPGGFNGVRADLTAQLKIGGSEQRGDQVRIDFDNDDPDVKSPLRLSAERVAQGGSVILTLEATDKFGIAKVDAVISPTPSFDFGAAIPMVPKGNNKYELRIKTDELKEDRNYYIGVKAFDTIGNTSVIRDTSFYVGPKAGPGAPEEDPEEQPGDIIARLEYKGIAPSLGKVTLEGTTNKGKKIRISDQKADGKGEFRFKNVPPGEYQLSGNGFVQNNKRASAEPVTGVKPSPPKTAKPIDVPLE